MGHDGADRRRGERHDAGAVSGSRPAAKLRLLANSETPALDINVDTNNGLVTLFGIVRRRSGQADGRGRGPQGRRREEVNDLQVVRGRSRIASSTRTTRSGTAIQTHFDANRSLDDSNIDIAVSNGVARLTGTVMSRSDQVAALTAARSTAGVVRVIDDLKLEPPAVSAR